MSKVIDTSELWSREYTKPGIPSSIREEPSGSVVEFTKFLKGAGVVTGYVIDIGSGTGRNTLFLAGQGYDVTAIDFVPELIEQLERNAIQLDLTARIKAVCQSVCERWPVKDASMDAAIDTFCFKHQIPAGDRARYKTQLVRTLKPGALFLLTLADIEDGYYGPLLRSSPRSVERIIVDPANGILSILYTEQDVKSEFQELPLRLVHHELNEKDGLMHGQEYLRRTHLFVFSRE